MSNQRLAASRPSIDAASEPGLPSGADIAEPAALAAPRILARAGARAVRI
ncbi:hypothetical protein [Nannocystis punicea]|uniref:Uncharacterized protein n=1 Tax=Nannocystis punicea TaxID=2995304 RepID=A0ABY7GXI1_9BACT|nr:hypothetical protein [Nannocystis poenicansa]WAS91653.1 hypothetical protein O0S08_36185 [Nannocystis poenicansa]